MHYNRVGVSDLREYAHELVNQRPINSLCSLSIGQFVKN